MCRVGMVASVAAGLFAGESDRALAMAAHASAVAPMATMLAVRGEKRIDFICSASVEEAAGDDRRAVVVGAVPHANGLATGASPPPLK